MHGFLIFKLFVLKNKIVFISEQTEVKIEACRIFSEKKENILSNKN